MEVGLFIRLNVGSEIYHLEAADLSGSAPSSMTCCVFDIYTCCACMYIECHSHHFVPLCLPQLPFQRCGRFRTTDSFLLIRGFLVFVTDKSLVEISSSRLSAEGGNKRDVIVTASGYRE